MIVGYARTSTTEQVAGFEAQERDFRAAGVEGLRRANIVGCHTGAAGGRARLHPRWRRVRRHEDRSASASVADLCAIVKRIESKGAILRILAINLDTATPTGKLMLNVLGERRAIRARGHA